ncbi:MAG: phage tail tape measure protein, partial [Clostridia bacterium]
MADVAAQLTVVIDAIDNASGVISGVAAELGGLGSVGNAAAGSTAAVNSALDNTARSGAAAGNALTTAAKGSIMFSSASARTASSTEQLTQRLETQKNTTRQYAAEVRNSAAVLRNKQAAVRDAAIAYKANTAPLKENISTLRNQQTELKSTITSRQNEITALTEANKSLKKSSQTYKDNQKAIQWTRVELSDAQQKYRAVSTEISNQEKALKAEELTYKAAQTEVKEAARSHEELRSKMHESTAAEKELTTAIGNSDAALAEQQRAVSNSAQAQSALVQSQEKAISTAEQWKASGKNLKEFGEGVDTLTKPLQAAAVAAVGLGIASGKAAVDFEENFAAVEKTVDGTPEQLENIKQGIIDMTTAGINGHKAIPLTTADLTELAAAGGQLGIETENILDFTETMAMLGTATNLSGEAGAQTLARFMNVTNTAQSDVRRLGSTIVDLGNNFATTEAEIANMAMDMGATGSEIGMSTQDILGYATALSSMGIEAAAGGSALQRIWMDMQNAVSSGGDSLEAFAKISGKSSKDFQEQWKKDASGAFRDFLKGLNESEDQVGLLTALGFNNVRDQRALMALAGEKGFNILTEAINRANKAWSENTALQNEFDKKAETTKSQIEVTKNNVIEAARSFGEVLLPEVAAATGGIADFAKGLADMDEGGKKA